MSPNRVTIVQYNDSYQAELEVLLKELSQELFQTGSCNIKEFVEGHWCIYLAIIDTKVIGFAGFVYNKYFGFRKPTVGLTYLYVKPEHRGSKANYLLNIQSGVLSISNNLPLEHHYASEHSIRMSRKVNGKKIYETWLYEVDEVMTAFKRLTSKVNIKENK